MPEPTPLHRALSERYTILRELGAGGMATVFLAEDLRHRRKVAIKVLHPAGPDLLLPLPQHCNIFVAAL